jgi:hypothetical protein
VALRVWGTPEVVVEPKEILAPGAVAVRPSGRVKRAVVFGFRGPPVPHGRPLRIEGETELVFALAGREIGRARTFVRPGETTTVEVPEIRPPSRR